MWARGPIMGSGGPLTLTYLGTAVDGDPATTFNFTSFPFGTASSDRYIVVGCGGRCTSAPPGVASVTIGGVSATLVVEQTTGSDDSASIWIAKVPSGTSGTITVVHDSSYARAGVGAWALTGLSNAGTAEDTDSTTTNNSAMSLTSDAGSVAVAASYNQSGSSMTWTGITEDYDEAVEATRLHSGGSAEDIASPLSVTGNWAGGGTVPFVCASFK